MESAVPDPGTNETPHGLPPVAPPSGRFIVQLFLVPGLIIAVAVLILLGFRYLVGSSRTADQYLRDLNNNNPDIRWRAAHDLAQVLKRPESLDLASDPKFALDLADLLKKRLNELDEAEKTAHKDLNATLDDLKQHKGSQEQIDEAKAKAWRALEAPRNNVLYLMACLGDFTIPVGVPLLGDIAVQDTGPDVKGTALRRRRAVWALANLGENLKRFQEVPEEKKEEILAALEAEPKPESSKGEKKLRAEWAKQTLTYLKTWKEDEWKENKKPPLGVDAILARCAEADDPYLRALTALALNFWDGDLVEPTLLRLARDDGHGERIEIGELD
jgi:hypothetical protein